MPWGLSIIAVRGEASGPVLRPPSASASSDARAEVARLAAEAPPLKSILGRQVARRSSEHWQLFGRQVASLKPNNARRHQEALLTAVQFS